MGKRRLAPLFLLALFLLPALTLGSAALTGPEAEAEAVTQSVLVEGRRTEVTAFRIGGRVYFPLRALAALLAETGSRFSLENTELVDINHMRR